MRKWVRVVSETCVGTTRYSTGCFNVEDTINTILIYFNIKHFNLYEYRIYCQAVVLD